MVTNKSYTTQAYFESAKIAIDYLDKSGFNVSVDECVDAGQPITMWVVSPRRGVTPIVEYCAKTLDELHYFCNIVRAVKEVTPFAISHPDKAEKVWDAQKVLREMLQVLKETVIANHWEAYNSNQLATILGILQDKWKEFEVDVNLEILKNP